MKKKFSITPYLFLVPALAVTAVFIIYPIICVVYYSFTDYDIMTPPVWIGLKNYIELAQDPTFLLALRNSFIYLIATPTLIVFGIIVAILVNRKLPGIHIFRALYYIPAISGSIAIGITWRMVFDTNGIINGLLMWMGILKEPFQWLAEPSLTLPLLIMLTIWEGVGYYMMVFLAGLQNIPEELYDAALIDGCNELQKHWHVSVPGLRPQITFVAVISSLAALKVFDEVYTLTSRTGGVLDSGITIVFYLWRKAFQLSHAGYASAIAIVLLAITLIFSLMNVRMHERGMEAE